MLKLWRLCGILSGIGLESQLRIIVYYVLISKIDITKWSLKIHMKNTIKKFSEKFVNQKIQIINFAILILGTIISGIASIVPPFDTFLKDNNVYQMVCFFLIASIGLTVYSIFDRLSKIKPDNHLFHSVKSIDKILSRIDDDLIVDIYFGIDNELLLQQLLKFLKRHNDISSKYKIFIKTCLINSVNEESDLSLLNFNLSCNLPEMILIHSKHNNLDHITKSYFIRFSTNNDIEYLTLDSDDEIMQTLTENIFENVKSIHLSNLFISKTMRYIFESNSSSIANLIEKQYLEIYGRDTFFKYMIDIIQNSTSDIYAIDFIPPKFWIEHNYTHEYGLAHKSIDAIKKRIHIIDLDKINSLKKTEKDNEIKLYKEYAKFMKECQVQLYFLDVKYFDTAKYEKRGSLVVENECVFVAINPSDGAPLGEIDFNKEKVIKYKQRFDDCLGQARLSDDFIDNTLINI